MSSGDFPVWLDFIRLYGSTFKGFYYDVAVGTPSEVPEGTSPELGRMWERITRRRLDAVGVMDEEWWLIEVRANARPSVAGEILVYLDSWKEDPPPEAPKVRGVVVARIIDPDTVKLLDKHGIMLITI